MDEKMARMMEQMKKNPAALRALMNSQDGQALMKMLTGPDQGARLQKAVQAAAGGDPSQLAEMINQITASSGGAALVDRLQKSAQK